MSGHKLHVMRSQKTSKRCESAELQSVHSDELDFRHQLLVLSNTNSNFETFLTFSYIVARSLGASYFLRASATDNELIVTTCSHYLLLDQNDAINYHQSKTQPECCNVLLIEAFKSNVKRKWTPQTGNDVTNKKPDIDYLLTWWMRSIYLNHAG